MGEWLPCGDGFIEADVIRWHEGIWEKRGPKKGRALKVGNREVIAEVLSEPDDQGFVWLLVRSCVVLPSKDHYIPKAGPLKVGEKLKRKKATVLRGKPMRLPWSEESVRLRLVGSKFAGRKPISAVSKKDSGEN